MFRGSENGEATSSIFRKLQSASRHPPAPLGPPGCEDLVQVACSLTWLYLLTLWVARGPRSVTLPSLDPVLKLLDRPASWGGPAAGAKPFDIRSFATKNQKEEKKGKE